MNVVGVYGMNALQLILEDLSTDHEERLQAIVDILVESFLPQLADQACVDVFELQTSLATELAFSAGAALKPQSALQLAAVLTEAIHAGASIDQEASLTEDQACAIPAGPFH
jgi:hypothetical protein